MDQFIVEFLLYHLQKQIRENKTSADEAFDALETAFAALTGRVTSLEGIGLTVDGAINTLRQQFTDLDKFSSTLLGEINKLKSMSLKQDMSIRTMHNLNLYKADDMYADTFTTGDNIDFDLSTRAEWMSDIKAVGMTRGSIAMVQQPIQTSALLISQNGASDDSVSQSFVIDKDRRVNKITLHLTKFSEETIQPIIVSLRESNTGTDILSVQLAAGEVPGGWIDIPIPDYILTGGQNYYIVITTPDIRGYKIGMDPTDKYMTGSSYSRFSGLWTDNNHDISFKVWCFPSEDENNATILSKKTTYATTPVSIVFEKEDFLENGTVIYYVSRDNGVNWKLLQPGVPTDLNDLPTGKDLVLKAYVTGASRIDAWSYVIVRGDS